MRPILAPSILPLAVAVVLLALLGLPGGIARAQEADEAPAQEEASEQESAESPLKVASVRVSPESPGPEALCTLTVEIANGAERAITAFGFDVTVAGNPLPVYDNQLFLKVVPAGETVELPLYNFWTSETGRPAPADGKMPVEVTLREARWVKLGEEDGTEVWELEGEVGGLPVTAETMVTLKK